MMEDSSVRQRQVSGEQEAQKFPTAKSYRILDLFFSFPSSPLFFFTFPFFLK